MRFLPFFVVFLLVSALMVSMGGRVRADDDNGNECIKDKLDDIGEISLLGNNLNAAPDVKARVDACNPSAPLTLFIPNNEAILGAISRIRSPNPQAGSVGELNDEQKQLLGALAAYHITSANESSTSLSKQGVVILNTTMANRPQFVQMGEGVPQRLLVVAGQGVQKNGAVLLDMQKNKKYFNGTSKIVLDQQFRGPNDALIVKKDIKCKDGYIHVIDKVLLLPKNVTDQLRTSKLTGFAALIRKAGAREWINELTGVTIFAPSNQALRQLDEQIGNKSISVFAASSPYQSFYQTKKAVFADAEAGVEAESEAEGAKRYKNLFALPKDKLMNLIKAHLFKGVKYSNAFKENLSFTNYNNTQFFFQNLNKTAAAGGGKTGYLRSTLSRFFSQHEDPTTNIANAIGNIPISFANIFTRNGVIHVLKGVLGPNITAIAKPKDKPVVPVPAPTPTTVIPASNATDPSVQAQAVGVACVNSTLLSDLSTITVKENTTLNTPAGPFKININGPIPDCPPSDQLCMVATLSNTCAIPPSPFQQAVPTDLVTAKPSEVNAAHANSITFTPRCFNPQTHVCVNNHFLCPTSHPSLCGDACYSSNQYKCFAKFSMCPSHAPNLCGEACYNEERYQCQRGVLKQKGQNGGKGSPAKNKRN